MNDFIEFMNLESSKANIIDNICSGSYDDTGCIDMMPLAMAYVPIQKYRDAYPLDTALETGTFFKELYKPFKGYKLWEDNK